MLAVGGETLDSLTHNQAVDLLKQQRGTVTFAVLPWAAGLAASRTLLPEHQWRDKDWDRVILTTCDEGWGSRWLAHTCLRCASVCHLLGRLHYKAWWGSRVLYLPLTAASDHCCNCSWQSLVLTPCHSKLRYHLRNKAKVSKLASSCRIYVCWSVSSSDQENISQVVNFHPIWNGWDCTWSVFSSEITSFLWIDLYVSRWWFWWFG